MKIIIVIAANEYSNSTSDIKVYGAFTTYKEANTKMGKVQKDLDKSTSFGWQVWTQETILTITEEAPTGTGTSAEEGSARNG